MKRMRVLLAGLLIALMPAMVAAQATVSPSSSGGGGVALGDNNAWTGTNSFWDTLFTIIDDGDNTKKIAFQASGITTGTTRTFTVPNSDGTLPLLALDQTWSGVQSFTGNTSFTSAGSAFFGTAAVANNGISQRTAQTPDTAILFTGTTSNHWLITEVGDIDFDFAHAAQTNPTLFIHSAAQNVNQWLGLTHTGTNGDVRTGSGTGLILNGTGSQLHLTGSNSAVFTPNTSNGSNLTLALNTLAGTANQIAWLSSTSMIGLNGTDSASPTNRTLIGQSGLGTNIAGGSVTLAPGSGTGTGLGGQVILNRSLRTTTGTTVQTQAPTYISCPSKILSNTSATTQAVATITTTTDTGGSVQGWYTTVAQSATAINVDTISVTSLWRNIGGTATVATTGGVDPGSLDSSGTLTTTVTTTASTNVVTMNVGPVWATIVPTLVTGYVTFLVNGVNSVVCQ